MKSQSKDIEIVPLGKEHLEPAAALVADRYREGRKINPLWPDKYHAPAEVLPLLAYRKEEQVGVAALRGGKVVGFIFIFPYDNFGLPVAWVPDWAHGAVEENRGYLYGRMYAALAKCWVAEGQMKHAPFVFAHEQDVLHALFNLGFGLNGIDADRDLSPVMGPDINIEIRRAFPEDVGTLMDLRKKLTFHLRETPVFAFLPGTAIEAGRKDFQRQLEDENYAILLAYDRHEVIGVMRAGPTSLEEFKMPVFDEGTCAISMAFTREDRRGKGVATALLNAVLAWGWQKGFTRCAVDFESANLAAARFWLKHFRPVCYNLTRFIDKRVYDRILENG